MSINPNDRFQTAESLRHELEQVPTMVNWNEKILPKSIKWSLGREKECIEVERIRLDNNKYDVVTKKGSSKHNLRRITKFCLYNATARDANKLTQNILEGYVFGEY